MEFCSYLGSIFSFKDNIFGLHFIVAIACKECLRIFNIPRYLYMFNKQFGNFSSCIYIIQPWHGIEEAHFTDTLSILSWDEGEAIAHLVPPGPQAFVGGCGLLRCDWSRYGRLEMVHKTYGHENEWTPVSQGLFQRSACNIGSRVVRCFSHKRCLSGN